MHHDTPSTGTTAARRAALVVLTLGLPLAAAAYDYPTADRVRFVQECMREHPGSHFEMTNKCVCTIDKIAQEVPHDQFVNGSTVLNANSIGGERGNTIRDTEILQNEAKGFRALLAKAKAACFINVASPR